MRMHNLQMIDQYLLLEEVEKEGSYQTKLTESESSGLSNPPIADVPIGGSLNAHDQTKNSPNLEVKVLKPLARQGNVTHHIDMHNDEGKLPWTINEVNTVVNTFDSLQHITPQLQTLTKVNDKFGKSVYTDVGLWYHLIQEDNVQPFLWELVESECK